MVGADQLILDLMLEVGMLLSPACFGCITCTTGWIKLQFSSCQASYTPAKLIQVS